VHRILDIPKKMEPVPFIIRKKRIARLFEKMMRAAGYRTP